MKRTRWTIRQRVICGMLFVFGLLLAGMGMPEGVSGAEADREEYVFDEEFWNEHVDVEEHLPRTPEEEERHWRSTLMGVYGRGTRFEDEYGVYIYEIISNSPKEASIILIKDTGEEVRIPSEVDGYKVTRIGESKRYYVEKDDYDDSYRYECVFMPSTCDKVTSLIIPDGVEYIGYNAFSCCRNLKSVRLPNTLTAMAPCFAHCYSLEELIFPEGTDMYYAILEDIPLKNLTIAGSVESLYLSGGMLEEFVVPDGLKHLSIYNTSMESLVVPEHVEKLVLRDVSELKSLVLEGGGIQLTALLLQNLPSLEEITIPNDTPPYGEWRNWRNRHFWIAAYHAMSDPDVSGSIFPGSYTELSVTYRMKDEPDGFFLAATGLETVRFTEGMTSFTMDGIVQDCRALKEVFLPESVRTIEAGTTYLGRSIRFVVPNAECEYELGGQFDEYDIERMTLVTPVNSRLKDLESLGIGWEPIARTNEDGERDLCYQVEKGDTLWAISRRCGTTVQELATANEIADPDFILIGQKLWIPEIQE